MNANLFFKASPLFSLPAYKWIGGAVLLALTAGAILFLAVKKKAGPANLILTAAIGAVLTAALMLTNFRPASDYRNPVQTAGEGEPAVELTVQCAALSDVADPDDLPDGGVNLFPTARLPYIEGESVDELLTRAANSAGFTVDRESGYVRGIAGVYEKAYGEMSGWIFTVNGEMPSVSAADCILSDGDRVEWRYCLDMMSAYEGTS